MSIKLWDWLEDLNWLVGADFPEADEDALWRCSDAWAGAAAELRRLAPEVIVAGQRVTGALGGESGDAFADLWRQYAADEGLVARVGAACEQLAVACDGAAVEVEYAKIQYIAALVVLAVALAALTASLVAGGVSALGIPVVVAAAQFTIRLILTRLVTAMAVGAAMNLVLDGLAQSIQLLAGHRQEWDLAKTTRAGQDGAIYGAVGGGVFLAAGRFTPSLLGSPLRLVVPLAATGALGGAAAALAHGESPTGHDFLLAVTSGIAGGLGPDLVHGKASTPDLSRLDALDRAGVDRAVVDRAVVDRAVVERAVVDLVSRSDSLTGGTGDSGLAEGGLYRVGGDDPGQLAGGAVRESPRVDPRADARPDLVGAGRPDGGGAPGGTFVAPDHTSGRADGPVAYPTLAPGSVVGAQLAPGHAPHSATNAAVSGSMVRAATSAFPMAGNPVGAGATTPAASSSPLSSMAIMADSAAGQPSGAGIEMTATPAAVGMHALPVGMHALPGPGGPAGLSSLSGPLSGVDSATWVARGGSAPDLPGWSDANGRANLTGLQSHAAELLLARAKEVEPRITEIARGIARDVGGTLFGEENRLKTADSAKTKLAQKLAKYPTLLDALSTMKDTVRYTVGLSADRYAGGSHEAMALLLERGFRPVGQARNWSDRPGYLGFNTFWSDPVSGHVFEVQFHTEASFVAKTISHRAFDELRNFERQDSGTPAYQALKAAHDAYFEDVPVPEGAPGVRIPADVAWHDPTGELPPMLHQRSAHGPAPANVDDGSAVPITDDGRHPVSDVEALALARQNVFETNAGLAFYAADDQVRAFARAVRPTDGYVTVDLHGSARGFQIGNGLLTPEQFAVVLHELRLAGVLNLPAGVGIKLLSCDTGRGGRSSPAAMLVRRLGVEVGAPDQPVWTALDGDEVVSSPIFLHGNLVPGNPPDGTWVRFIPAPAATGGSRPGPRLPPPVRAAGE